MPNDPPFPGAGKWLRAFDEVEARAEPDRARDEQMRRLLLSLLDVADSIERFEAATVSTAPPTAEQADQWRRSVLLIGKQLRTSLAAVGVAAIECLGRPFDPHVQHQVEARPCPAAQIGTVVEEVRRGYTWNGQCLRQPQVAVGTQTPEEQT